MKFQRILLGFVGILLILIGGLGGFLWWQYTKLKPEYHDVNLEGLQSEVIIHIDSLGVGHIDAANERDALVAMGYWVASQRLWQMELMRRTAMGRLSELFGDTTLAIDRLFRTLSLEDVGLKIYENASPESRAWLDAYTEGVNLFMQTTDELPVEFQLLNFKPEPWQPVHSILIERLMAWMLNFSWRADWVIALLKEKLPSDLFQQVVPMWPQTAPKIGEFKAFNKLNKAFHLLSRNEAQIRHTLGFAVNGIGSNNWVISGKKTHSGKPILANDPHLMLSLPSIWIQVVIQAPHLTVGGYALPGAPGIVIGRNKDLAWGFTNGMVDDSDYLIPDSVNLEKGVVWVNGMAENLEKIDNLLISKNKKHALTVYRYHGMPLFNMVFEPPLLNIPVFLQWSGFDVSDELQAFIHLARAKSVAEGIQALRAYHVPAQNVVFADKHGNIGYKLSGNVPRRNLPTGIVPVKYQQGLWRGYYEFEALPQVINPESGVIYTANNKIKSSFYISDVWEPEFRAQRIREMLLSNDTTLFSRQDVQRMQLDVVSLPAREWLPGWIQSVLKHESALSTEEKELLMLLKNWDAQAFPEKVAPLIYQEWLHQMVEELFKPQLGDTLFQELVRLPSLYWRMTFSILKTNESKWFGSGKEQFLLKTYRQALKTLHEKAGNPENWQWGQYHKLLLRHAMGSVPLLGRIFNRGPYPVGGDPFTINVGHYRFKKGYQVTVGASMRMVAEMNDDVALYVNFPGGNSGNPFSNFYANQLPLWLKGKYQKIKFLGNQNWVDEFKLLPIKNMVEKE